MQGDDRSMLSRFSWQQLLCKRGSTSTSSVGTENTPTGAFISTSHPLRCAQCLTRHMYNQSALNCEKRLRCTGLTCMARSLRDYIKAKELIVESFRDANEPLSDYP